ncbi:hypothetical protein HY768_09435 [candidate division TA06 bacterium]|uniref:Uncharacterized protein n=1 Tax=candidate division TA06 bacterium TaxID=2250710 RepID=A0A933IA62_UNCT6|nr:hypothetical protein [candidate division TA06 bacterium]
MKIVDKSITRVELIEMAKAMFGNMVKAVVDVEQGIMAVGGELHSDEEGLLLQNGSVQKDLWGINIYPGAEGPDWIEFDSMINLRPTHNNLSRGVDDKGLQEKIIKIVSGLVQ